METVRTRLYRARQRLRASLDDRWGGRRAAWAGPLALLAHEAAPALAGGIGLAGSKGAVAAGIVLVVALATAWLAWESGTEPTAPPRRHGSRAEAPPDTEAPGSSEASGASVVRAMSLRGRCVSATTGRPLADVEVSAGEDRTRTGPDGTFEFDVGADAEFLHVAKAGFFGLAVPVPGSGEAGELRLSPAPAVRGSVVTADGMPAGGAQVRLLGERGAARARGIADADGRFAIPMPADLATSGTRQKLEAVTVAAFLPGWQPQRVRVSWFDEDVRLRLERAAAIRGFVLAKATGRPIPGATLHRQNGRSGDLRWRVGTAGTNGAFEVAAGGADTFLFVEAEGYFPLLHRYTDRDEELRFELQEAEAVRGQLVDPQGRPIGGATLTFTPGRLRTTALPEDVRRARETRRRALENDGRRAPEPSRVTFDSPTTVRAHTDDHGGFRVDLPRAPFQVSGYHDYMTVQRDVLEFPTAPLRLVMGGKPDYQLTVPVRVLDVDGQPLRGAAVNWWMPNSDNTWPYADQLTDSHGDAKIWFNAGWTNIPTVTVYARAQGRFGVAAEAVDPKTRENVIEVRCRPTSSVHGCVRSAGGAVRALVGLWWWQGDRTRRIDLTRAAPDGTFSFRNVPAGRCTALAVSETLEAGRAEFRVNEAEGPVDAGEIGLSAPVRLRGRVLDRAGRAMDDGMVRWIPGPWLDIVRDPLLRSRTSALLEADGSFEITVWSEGPVRLRAGPGSRRGTPGRTRPIPARAAVTVECRPGRGPIEIVVPID